MVDANNVVGVWSRWASGINQLDWDTDSRDPGLDPPRAVETILKCALLFVAGFVLGRHLGLLFISRITATLLKP